MQIHELTQSHKPAQVDEGLADIARSASDKLSKAGYALSPRSGLANIKAAWQQGKVATQSRKLADQSQDAWGRYVQNWEATMEPDEKAKFAARKDSGLYKRQLTAWVQKNMLSGMTLANLTNRSEILSIIDALSAPKQLPPVKEAKKRNTLPAGAVRDPVTGKASVVDPRLEKAYQAQQAAKSGAAAPAAAPAPEPAAPAAAPDATPPSSPGLTPSEEKRLWLKLAQEVGRAQMAAYTGEREAQAQNDAEEATAQAAQANAAPQGDPTPTLQQALGDQAKNIGAIGAVVQQQAATTRVKSTGNAVVDAALRLMGFTVS